ncbi:MAG: hypothetical protein GC190_16140 [Alphaproteobacteria bacterium]|nr:hypothetical protein [Alphaproteobacteria bacterium]
MTANMAPYPQTASFAKAAITLLQRVVERVGRYTRAFLRVFALAKVVGVGDPTKDLKIDREALQWMCISIPWLLERHVVREPPEAWPDDGWIDGFGVERVDVVSPDEIYLEGLFVWVQGQERWWLDPGAINIKLLFGTDIVAPYKLTFGDATIGLAKRPYSHRAVADRKVEEWLFEFEGPRHSGLNA